MSQIKILFFSIFSTILCCIFFVPQEVHAADKFQLLTLREGEEKKVGDTVFSTKMASGGDWELDAYYEIYYQKPTDSERHFLCKGEFTQIITDGETVYYVGRLNELKENYGRVYGIKVSDKEKKKIFTSKGVPVFYGYYKHKIFYSLMTERGSEILFCYDLKKEKKEQLLPNIGRIEQYGSIFLCTPTYMGEGDSVPFDLWLCNAKTNKTKRQTKYLLADKVIGNKIYYAELVKNCDSTSDSMSNGNHINVANEFICNVIRCDLNGNHKQILLKNQRINGRIQDITSSHIVCCKLSDPEKTYKIKYKK